MIQQIHKRSESDELPRSILDAIRDLITRTPRALFEAGRRRAVQPGQRIGRFEVVARLGSGGMGEVWKAMDRSLDRHVALKLLSPRAIASRHSLDRLWREARAGARLSHPNIVAVYDFDQHNGLHYIVQELVSDGRTLADVIDQHRQLTELPAGYEDAVAALFLAVTEALYYAHREGVIHRDVKPSNILIDEEGRARVVDFGLASVKWDHSPSKTDDFAGTPQYMSPEQVAAGRIGLDHRTDVFSTGASMFEALTLTRPFDAATPTEALRKVVVGAPPDAIAANPRISIGLRDVCLRALEKDPDRRHRSMGELVAALKACTSPIEGSPHAGLFQSRVGGRTLPTDRGPNALSRAQSEARQCARTGSRHSRARRRRTRSRGAAGCQETRPGTRSLARLSW
ncbi:MAG: serine/threonine-protein kinase [Planctomycetota bacterium]